MFEKEITVVPQLSSPPPASQRTSTDKIQWEFIQSFCQKRHMVMYSRILHLELNGSSLAVLPRSDRHQAMRDGEFSEKGKTQL
ncbi:hypothetical protein PFLUV_G00062980 [Perca fluviatilis]|uniref:Uncharacterized protein n=1 Tax=Perca fluviatilis TaxID=8168 RepID=A0A6A5ENI1_PERFL|nr:hypothetical protein PFLUV_G00062980 [Perca fluviatilis]